MTRLTLRLTAALAAQVLIIVLWFPLIATATTIWRDVPQDTARFSAVKLVASKLPALGRQLIADETALRDRLAQATETRPVRLMLPNPDGGMREFEVWRSPVMAAELAARYPMIQSYRARAVDDARVQGRISLNPKGFYAYISDVAATESDVLIVDPVPQAGTARYLAYSYRQYSQRFAARRQAYRCGVTGETVSMSAVPKNFGSSTLLPKTEQGILNYRLAVATTYEYSQAVGGDVASVLAAVATAIDRVNVIFRRDLGVQLTLVANNDQIVYTTPNDPYTNNNSGLLVDENQQTIDAVIGSGNYDIGHVFNTDPGGLAGLGVVCANGAKARGETGAPVADLTSDAFYIDFLAHELGHQLGANHSFNGTTDACRNSRNASTAYEPGSGISIMGYAGICGAENINVNSIAAFHAGSIGEIIAITRSPVGGCATTTGVVTNTAPVVNAGADFTIPGDTPFELNGSANDAQTANLLYSWDQMDAGQATNTNSYGLDLGSNALFRPLALSTSAVRTFPDMQVLMSNVADKAQTLPTQTRSLRFRLTARDGEGGVDADDMVIDVDGSKGPFRVLQPNTAITLNSVQDQVIEWNNACTNEPPVSCSTVDISYSVDGGQSWNVLLAGTPNDGAATVNFAASSITNNNTVRIKVACAGNIFFDISDVDFALSSVSGSVLGATNTPQTCGTQQDYGTVSGNDIEPNDYPGVAQPITLPFSVQGGVDDTVDFYDFFRFSSDGGVYVITLSAYGTNDLDLYLLDNTGETVVAESTSETGASESIRIGLAFNKDYYIVVDGYDTAGQNSAYTLTVTRGTAAVAGGSKSGMLSVLLIALLASLMLMLRRVYCCWQSSSMVRL